MTENQHIGTCPTCASLPKSEMRTEYCKLSGPNAQGPDIIAKCQNKTLFIEFKTSQGNNPDLEDPCMLCAQNVVEVQEGTLISFEMKPDDQDGFKFVETHCCDKCSTVFTIVQ